ncbi:right-handed parallel beta-helix repeat-containing protein [Oxalobacteraceae bacterium A2-2]
MIGIIVLSYFFVKDRNTHIIPKTKSNIETNCIPVTPETGPYKEAVIWEPGVHCVKENFWQQRLSDFAGHTGPAPYRRLIEIRSNDVILDLNGNTLHTDGDSSGIVAVDSSSSAAVVNLTIRNGIVDLRGIGDGIDVSETWPFWKIEGQPKEKLVPFKKTRIILENLTIKTDGNAIQLEGDGNIIRNCIIESSGDFAIGMVGPNGKILNNKILLLDPFFPTRLMRRQIVEKIIQRSDVIHFPRSAILLYRATNTLIQGNRIEVEGKSDTRHNIYLANQSTGVIASHNIIVGKEEPAKLLDQSSITLADNSYEPVRPWYKSLKSTTAMPDSKRESKPMPQNISIKNGL